MSVAALMLVAGAALDPAALARFADLALDCVHREYPNKIAHVLDSDATRAAARADAGVLGLLRLALLGARHWLLARLARLEPGGGVRARGARGAGAQLHARGRRGELAYLARAGARGLRAALRARLAAAARRRAARVGRPDAQRWAGMLAPLERSRRTPLCATGCRSSPTRSAAASTPRPPSLSAWRWTGRAPPAMPAGGAAGGRVASSTWAITDCPLGYEPSGHDFLSPCLAEADLMRRVLPPEQFRRLAGAVPAGHPGGRRPGWLPVARVTDRVDGKLAHIDGLNLSRAWMLEGIAAACRPGDLRRISLRAAAAAHAAAGLEGVSDEHYAGSHWLGSFATYLVTGRGLAGRARAAPAGAQPGRAAGAVAAGAGTAAPPPVRARTAGPAPARHEAGR
jgi:hypothetical protein